MKKLLIDTVVNTLKSSTHKFQGLEDFSEQVLIDYILTLSKQSIIIDYTKIKETKEELLLENEALRCELDVLKKLQALIQAEEKAIKRKS